MAKKNLTDKLRKSAAAEADKFAKAEMALAPRAVGAGTEAPASPAADSKAAPAAPVAAKAKASPKPKVGVVKSTGALKAPKKKMKQADMFGGTGTPKAADSAPSPEATDTGRVRMVTRTFTCTPEESEWIKEMEEAAAKKDRKVTTAQVLRAAVRMLYRQEKLARAKQIVDVPRGRPGKPAKTAT